MFHVSPCAHPGPAYTTTLAIGKVSATLCAPIISRALSTPAPTTMLRITQRMKMAAAITTTVRRRIAHGRVYFGRVYAHVIDKHRTPYKVQRVQTGYFLPNPQPLGIIEAES